MNSESQISFRVSRRARRNITFHYRKTSLAQSYLFINPSEQDFIPCFMAPHKGFSRGNLKITHRALHAGTLVNSPPSAKGGRERAKRRNKITPRCSYSFTIVTIDNAALVHAPFWIDWTASVDKHECTQRMRTFPFSPWVILKYERQSFAVPAFNLVPREKCVLYISRDNHPNC